MHVDTQWCVLRGSGSALAPQDEVRGLPPLGSKLRAPEIRGTNLLILRCSAKRSLEGRNNPRRVRNQET